tara:strand:- start:37 stop:405 length:369 start_codon:yes stop_codon:yes gene_type:complete
MVDRGLSGLFIIGYDFVQLLDGKLVQVRQTVAVPKPAKGFGLEASAVAMRTFNVGSETREEDANMHLVGFLFQPVEEALDPVPGIAVPIFGFVLFPELRLSVDNYVLMLLRELIEGSLGGDF